VLIFDNGIVKTAPMRLDSAVKRTVASSRKRTAGQLDELAPLRAKRRLMPALAIEHFECSGEDTLGKPNLSLWQQSSDSHSKYAKDER
jgi:hypothetical protein